MKRNSGGRRANPFLIWTSLAFRTGEMMMASAQVIGHRTNRMVAAGPRPDARDQREFALMGQEKIAAAAESALAIASHMTTMNQQLATQAFGQMMTGATAMLSLAMSRRPTQAIERQARVVRDMSRAAITASHLAGSGARLTERGMKPIHKRATANAKRLGKG